MKKLENKKEVSFKEYNQSQMILLPPCIEDLIPEIHMSRIVNRIVNGLDYNELILMYPGGGNSSYDPKMLIKVIVYAYLEKVYSGRRIEKLLNENVVFMWLSGNNKPNYRTINRFRSGKLGEIIREVFEGTYKFCEEVGLITYENYFTDGSKFQADANKNKIVWRKNVERYKQAKEAKIKELFEQIDKIIETENKEEENKEDIKAKLVSEEAQDRLNKLIEEMNGMDGKKKKLLKPAKNKLEEWIPQQKRYEEQLEILGDRNSYSKTDTDAIGLRMKDETIKPGYNLMIGTENQVVLNYSVHAKAGDTDCFIEHMEKIEEIDSKYCENIIGDAGFGSEENYRYIEEKGLNNYLKYNTFFQESKKRFTLDLTKKENFIYDNLKDEYICGNERRLIFTKEIEKKTRRGYTQKLLIYECEDCTCCPIKCTKSENRTIQINKRLEGYKWKARLNLNSEKGKVLRSLRSVDVESVFGDIKRNAGFTRFNLRGIYKVSIDIGLVLSAHNIRKAFKKMISENDRLLKSNAIYINNKEFEEQNINFLLFFTITVIFIHK
jgi:transposase